MRNVLAHEIAWLASQSTCDKYVHGPIVGGGLPFLVVGGAGFGVYWLVRRSRRKYS
jgi:hypothetical protein